MVLRLYVHIDETQSLFLAFDLYIIILYLRIESAFANIK